MTLEMKAIVAWSIVKGYGREFLGSVGSGDMHWILTVTHIAEYVNVFFFFMGK